MSDYDILFLSKLIPEHMEDEVASKSRHNMEDAANALQWHLIGGIDENNNKPVQLCNLVPIGSFPKYYADSFIKTAKFSHRIGADDKNVGFCNLCYVKQILRQNCVSKHIFKWSRKDTGKTKIIISYTPDIAFLNAMKYAKKNNPDILCCVIIADLPSFLDLSSNGSKLVRLYKKYNANRVEKQLNHFDMFVFLTKQMGQYLNITKPSIVIEGVATDSFQIDKSTVNEDGTKTLFYAGTLHRKYGILNLLEAFKSIGNKNYRLIICGIGDSVADVVAACKDDNRIRYYGQLPRKEVLKLMVKATVLVNPRQNNEEFTKYSFPSKNLEYLSSGIPLLAYKLDGIPNEYDNYIYYIEGDSLNALKAKIIEVCEKDHEELKRHGQEAKKFVLSNKNSKVQASKIMRMIDDLINMHRLIITLD